jgi:transposase
MSRNKLSKLVFKPYSPNQMMLLPPSLDELIPAGHPVRVVNEVIESIDISPLLKNYKSGGTSSYHPKMLLKIMVYAYMTNVYSSRKMENALRESIFFMWLSGMSYPDHNTINRFRSERLADVLKDIFKEVVLLLSEQGLISLKEVYTDGTKMEANANRYSFVWGNSIKHHKEKIKQQVNELWKYAQSVAADEMQEPEPPDFDNTPIDSKKVKETIEKIDEVLKDKEVDKKVKAKLRYAKNNFAANLDKYEAQEQLLDGRNSYSKTDEDATFMRMKDDHMKNGQLKPGYNVQISTSNQYIVNYSIHSNPNDTGTLKEHLEQHRQSYDHLPDAITTDAGYGSEENFQYLEEAGIEAYVKYSYFDKEQSKSDESKRPFTIDKLHYNKDRDEYTCPIGQPMRHIGSTKKKTAAGFEQTTHKYQAQHCNQCPLNGSCHKSNTHRIIEVNHNLNRYKQRTKELLNSEEGIAHRKQRPIDVEPVFGNIKQNHGFRRFMLRGKEKVGIEWGLLSIAQNLRKKAA